MIVDRPLGLGLVGAGAMARAYAECLRHYVSGARLVAITGGRRAAALGGEYGIPADPTMESLLARPEVEAVIIATPEMMHREQTLLAAASGRHVLVEKPMAPDVAACDAMIGACEKARVTLMVVKHWRFRGVHVRARELLKDGALGGVRRVENHTLVALSSSLETLAKKPFYLDPAGGGLLMGWAVHNLDWVRCMAGRDPLEVRATFASAAPDWLPEGRLEAEFSFADGVTADVSVAIDLKEAPGPDHVFRTKVTTDAGVLDLDGYGALVVEQGNTRKRIWTQPAFDPRKPTDPVRLEAYAAMLQGFVDSVRNRTPPPVTGRDGRMAVAMLEAARASAAGKRAVRIS